MADVTQGQNVTLYVDLPGVPDDSAVTLTITDPRGVASNVVGELATSIGGGRFNYIVPGEYHDTPGVWTAEWFTPGNPTPERQVYTVASQHTHSMTKSRLRRQVASRVGTVHHGIVTDAMADQIVDRTLRGGKESYVGWWVVIESGNDMVGMVRRVVDYNGDALVLSTPLPEAPPPTTLYTLYSLPPREIDDAIETAFSDFIRIGWVPVSVSGVGHADGIITIPPGFAFVHRVLRETVEENEEVTIPRADWEMLSGKRLRVRSGLLDDDDTLTLYGMRSLYPPLWEFSLLDVDPQALIARAAYALHTMRAAGPGIDVKEHLRRSVAAFNEQSETLRRSAGRLVAGMREVLD